MTSGYDDDGISARRLARAASDSDGERQKRQMNPVVIWTAVIIAMVLLLISFIVVLLGFSLNRVSANEWGCQYGGGAFESKGLKQTVAPGKSGGAAMFDTLKKVPSDDRFYFIDSDPNTADIGATQIIVPAQGTSSESQGIVNVNVEVQVRFVINENACDLYTNKLKRLEPLKFDTSDGKSPGGWGSFLNTQFNQALIKASRPLVAPYNYIQLYSNSTIEIDTTDDNVDNPTSVLIYDFMESEYADRLTAELNATLGKTYFCGPTYIFDKDVDGKFDTGCPPIEVTVKRVSPVDGQLIQNLETTVKNQEQIKVIESEKQKALAQTNADQTTQLANISKEQAVETAKAAKDQAVAEAQKLLFEARNTNEQIKAQAETAFCAQLTTLGVDCAEYFKSINWKPTTIIGSGTGTNVNVTP
jgi:hypothetical protein